jgi:hypothetical protein
MSDACHLALKHPGDYSSVFTTCCLSFYRPFDKIRLMAFLGTIPLNTDDINACFSLTVLIENVDLPH